MNILPSVKTLNKQINHDLKIFSKWFNTNKISLNVGKAELFNSPELKIKLSGERLYQTDPVKYLELI